MQVLTGPKKGVRCLAFSPDGATLAAGCYDGWLWRLELASGVAKKWSKLGATPKFAVWTSADAVATSTGDHWVGVLRDDGSGGLALEVDETFGGACLSADGRVLLVSARDSIRRWELAGDRELKPWPAWSPGFLAASADGKWIASTHRSTPLVEGDTFHLLLRDAKTGKQRMRLTDSVEFYDGLAFSPDGSRLAVAKHQSVWLWELPAGRVVASHKFKKFVTGIAFAPDGRTFATTGNDGFIRVWDGRSGAEVKAFDWQLDKALCVTFATDGSRAAAGGSNGKVVVWDVE